MKVIGVALSPWDEDDGSGSFPMKVKGVATPHDSTLESYPWSGHSNVRGVATSFWGAM